MPFLPDAYFTLTDSDNHFTGLMGYVGQVGLCEEACKILPVLIYMAWKRKNAKPLTIVLLGVFSGLGFAAFENLSKLNGEIIQAVQMNKDAGDEGIATGVQVAMVTAMLRSVSNVFGHATYCGVFAYFLALAHTTGKRFFALLIVGWLVSATIHGLYDWFWTIQNTLPALITAFGFVLFYAYLTKLRLVMASGGEGTISADVP